MVARMTLLRRTSSSGRDDWILGFSSGVCEVGIDKEPFDDAWSRLELVK